MAQPKMKGYPLLADNREFLLRFYASGSLEEKDTKFYRFGDDIMVQVPVLEEP